MINTVQCDRKKEEENTNSELLPLLKMTFCRFVCPFLLHSNTYQFFLSENDFMTSAAVSREGKGRENKQEGRRETALRG